MAVAATEEKQQRVNPREELKVQCFAERNACRSVDLSLVISPQVM